MISALIMRETREMDESRHTFFFFLQRFGTALGVPPSTISGGRAPRVKYNKSERMALRQEYTQLSISGGLLVGLSTRKCGMKYTCEYG